MVPRHHDGTVGGRPELLRAGQEGWICTQGATGGQGCTPSDFTLQILSCLVIRGPWKELVCVCVYLPSGHCLALLEAETKPGSGQDSRAAGRDVA